MTELVFRDDAYARSCAARVVGADARGIRLDRTVFYPTGGGQPGDTGSLRLASGETIAIVDAVKGDGPDEVIHVPAPGTVLPPPATELTAEIDWEGFSPSAGTLARGNHTSTVVPSPILLAMEMAPPD